MQTGYFISVEGGEGAGKTSAIAMMVEHLERKGFGVLSTREPGGIPIAEQIRQVILDRANTEMDGRTEALLYAAARRQHLTQKVLPALRAGKAVVCDRFVDSSLAYQGFARGLGIDEVWSINDFAVEGHMPDLTIWLDVSPEVGLSRIHADAGREINRLDLEKQEFHNQVREGYLQLQERFPTRIVSIDANRDIASIHEEIRQVLDARTSLLSKNRE
ncbi:dTMP kinase [Paenibacillus koleovorans]|uniref:dTMP kinase n=1 Tax=Paenibacillus koleovorans TaxID=121608 RepID=UPI000FD791DC|nr:dTMP kinase [Paenibacillus koleovorans]